ncbi:hypothetical protein H4W79_004209 [Nocardiopsis terrae]|uniref:Uncharacterized protein n=1 Tax=Nocardiopsis terrae TaxID=372655 RepID=A0ABR9HLW1_9ACTN|nr:hypothetical protein [Nocardiopsis terrae]MBE1459995.1 hypothetical protein [Nocardiopsis terrae]
MNTLLTSATVLAGDFALDKDTVTPGVLGFLAVFAIGVCLYFLMRSLVGKLRGVSARAETFGSAGTADGDGREAVAGADAAATPERDPSARG